MSNKFDVCFSTNSKIKLPIDTNDEDKYRQFRKDNPHIFGSFIPAGTPFILSEGSSINMAKVRSERPDIACAFDTVKSWSQETKRNIANLTSEFGDENLQAIAYLYEKEIKPFLDATSHTMGGKIDEYTAVGAAATAINEKQVRLSNFGSALLKYQNALLDLRAASKSGSQKKEVVKLGYKVKEAHNSLNTQFSKELAHYAGRVKSSKGNIWSNPNRAINIARSGRDITKLHLTSMTNIRSIRFLEQGSSIVGKKIIAIDAGVRFNNVRNAKNNGEGWQKRAAMEVAGFGASNAAGAWTTSKVIASGMGIALAAGPFGVVVLIGVGLGAGYAAAKMGDWFGPPPPPPPPPPP
ncbi:hypothetical protein, partial [Vibrio diabolicus]|uniref:hypothetical protein n=1 Tax=Vibrio diabolicus TaxID=50719 RepID=UPI00211B0D05